MAEVAAFFILGRYINLGPIRNKHKDGSRQPRDFSRETPVKDKGDSEQKWAGGLQISADLAPVRGPRGGRRT